MLINNEYQNSYLLKLFKYFLLKFSVSLLRSIPEVDLLLASVI